MSPASKKRFHAELEADIAALSSHSSDTDVLDPNQKTPEVIAAWCAEYERASRRAVHKHQRKGIEGMYQSMRL
jgi:hypothetical protein